MILWMASVWNARICVLAALLPAIYLMLYIYRLDRVEKEPLSVLLQLAGYGVLAALLAIAFEAAFEDFLLPVLNITDTTVLAIVTATGVGVIKEGCKFILLRRRTWEDANFNFRYDGIVYAVFVSLGFAAFENILYVFQYGLEIAPSRALLAVPAHFGFAVVMGMFYGRAKVCQVYGDDGGTDANLRFGYLLAVGLHAFYDAAAMIETSVSILIFLTFVVVMYIVIYRLVRKEAAMDRPLGR